MPVAIREGVYPGGDEILVQVLALPTASIRGRLLDSSGVVPTRTRRGEEAPAGVQLRIGDFDECGKRSLDENGNFTLEQLPAGTYTVFLNADGYPRDSELVTFELSPGQHLDLGLLSLPEPARLEVQAFLDRESLIDLRMHLAAPEADWWEGIMRGHSLRPDRDDTDGLFHSGPLMPGTYVLHAYFDNIAVYQGLHVRKKPVRPEAK